MKIRSKILSLFAAGLVALLPACFNTSDAPVIKQPEWTAQPGTLAPGQHNPMVNSTAITGNGKIVVGGTFYHSYGASVDLSTKGDPSTANDDGQSGNFGIYCYTSTGKPLWQDQFTAWQGVYWVDISSNGAYAAAGGWFSGAPNYSGFVRVYNGKTGKQLLPQPISTKKRVNQVQFSGDGTWLISVAETLILYKLDGQTCVVSDTQTLADSKDYIVTGGISKDGSTVVCGTYNGLLIAYSNNAGKLTKIGQFSYPPKSYCHMLQVDAKGQTFVAGGAAGQVYYFKTTDINNPKPTVSFQTESKGSIYGVAIADDGSAFVGLVNKSSAGLVYMVSADGTLRWKSNLQHNPNCASLNLKANLLAIADGHPNNTPGCFYLFDVSTGKERWECPTPKDMSWPIAISADGTGIVAGSDDSSIYYFKP